MVAWLIDRDKRLCQERRSTQRKESLKITPLPQYPLQNIGCDLCEVKGSTYTVMLIYYPDISKLHTPERRKRSLSFWRWKMCSLGGVSRRLWFPIMVHSLHHESSQHSRHRYSSSISSPPYPKNIIACEDPFSAQQSYRATPICLYGSVQWEDKIWTSLPTITPQFVPRWPAPYDVVRNDERAKAAYTSDFSPFHLSASTLCSVSARIMTCQCLRSSAISVVISFLAISSFARSRHLSCGLPRVLFPSTVICNICLLELSFSRLCTCPNHLNLFSVRNSVIGYMCASFQMSTFLTWSSLVFRLAHRSMCISVVCNFLCSFFLTAQHSAPYTMAGFIAVLYNLSFNFVGMFLSHFTPLVSLHFDQAIFTLLFISFSAPPLASNTLSPDTWTFSLSSFLFPECR